VCACTFPPLNWGECEKFNMPIAYDADADKKSAAEAKSFFAGVFK